MFVDQCGRSIKNAAERINVSYESMRRWCDEGIPIEKALEVEAKSGGLLRAEDILQYRRENPNQKKAA